PFGPRNPKTSPGSTANSMPSTAAKSSKRLMRLSAVTIDIANTVSVDGNGGSPIRPSCSMRTVAPPGGDRRPRRPTAAVEDRSRWPRIASISGRTECRDAVRLGGLGEAVIVGDHRLDLFAEVEGGREMDGVERTKPGRIHSPRAVEDRRGGSEERHGLDHPTGLDHPVRCDAANDSEQFRAHEI